MKRARHFCPSTNALVRNNLQDNDATISLKFDVTVLAIRFRSYLSTEYIMTNLSPWWLQWQSFTPSSYFIRMCDVWSGREAVELNMFVMRLMHILWSSWNYRKCKICRFLLRLTQMLRYRTYSWVCYHHFCASACARARVTDDKVAAMYTFLEDKHHTILS